MKSNRLDPERLEQCACLSARKTARAVTRAFDAALAPSGLEATQFTVLAALAGASQTVGRLADELVMDRTTLSRNVQPLQRAGLLSVRQDRDARRRVIALTGAGSRKLKAAFPLWRKAQRETMAAVGRSRFVDALESMSELTAASIAPRSRG
jgi:DNA-binding MarR family transcriptional regulator